MEHPSFSTYLSTLPRTPLVEAVSTLYRSSITEAVDINLDDDLAAKFATTANEIYKVTIWVANKIEEFGNDFINYMLPRLDDPKEHYNATIAFSFSDMGLSADFVEAMPVKLALRFVKPDHSNMYPKGANVHSYACADTAGLMADLDEGKPEYAVVSIFIHPGMETTASITNVIKQKLPHEMRHVVDTCDKATLQMMQDSLTNNSLAFALGNFAKYWDDPGEYYARLNEVIVFAMHVLSNPANRARVHSAHDVVSILETRSSVYREALGDVDDTAKQLFNKNLEAVLAKVMDKLI